MDQKPKSKKKGKPIEIELNQDEAAGTYSNLVMITHSPSEFVFDFISMMCAQSESSQTDDIDA